MTDRIAIRLALAAAAFALAGVAGAAKLDVKNLPEQEIQSGECKTIQWQADLLARFPRIAAACQEVVVSKGTSFARFTGSLVQVNADGSVKVDFKDRAGVSVGMPTLRPAAGQRVAIDGRRLKFSELDRGAKLNFYVPESRFAIATELDAEPAAMASIVPEPAVAADPVLVAHSSFGPVAQMPHTATYWPWIAIAGILALLGAVALAGRKRMTLPFRV